MGEQNLLREASVNKLLEEQNKSFTKQFKGSEKRMEKSYIISLEYS
jgi:hypothetical protein